MTKRSRTAAIEDVIREARRAISASRARVNQAEEVLHATSGMMERVDKVIFRADRLIVEARRYNA